MNRIKVFMTNDDKHPTVGAQLSLRAGTLKSDGSYWVEADFTGAIIEGTGQRLPDALRELAKKLEEVEIWVKL